MISKCFQKFPGLVNLACCAAKQLLLFRKFQTHIEASAIAQPHVPSSQQSNRQRWIVWYWYRWLGHTLWDKNISFPHRCNHTCCETTSSFVLAANNQLGRLLNRCKKKPWIALCRWVTESQKTMFTVLIVGQHALILVRKHRTRTTQLGLAHS